MIPICITIEIEDLEIYAKQIVAEPDVNIPAHYEFTAIEYNGVNIMPLLCDEDFDNIQEYLFNTQP